MAFLIGGANSAAADDAYEVANSCRFNDGDSAYMHKALGTPTSTKIGTLSTWFKRGQLDQEMNLLGAETDTNSRGYLQLDDGVDGILHFWWEEGSTVTSLKTNRLLRDISAWYHVVVAYDTSQSTASNRVKIYINGVQETSFGTETYPPQDNITCPWNIDGYNTSVGAQKGGAGTYGTFFDGYQAETVFIDGLQLGADSFGEFDSDSPTIWKPIDVSGLTFGNNGYYLDYESSGNLGNDANGGTDFTEVNLAAADQATDSPTNNFCTLNTLVPTTGFTFSEGNCKMVSGGSDTKGGGIGTFGLTAGKWWWEIKMASTLGNHTHGVISELTTELTTVGGASALQNDTGVTQFRNDDGGEMNKDGTQTTADYGTFDDGDIMGIAFNADDNEISIYDNGSAIVSDFTISTTRGAIFPFFGSGISTTFEINFGGCSSFAISSAANDANGYGVFEHAPPSGYLALCSKNLGSDGG